MSGEVPTVSSPICGLLGCHADATAVIHHPQHGRRTVCDGHTSDFEVIGDV